MIKKIVHIKNYGKYRNFVSDTKLWNGVFNKTTAIYADNGSGKTTLTQLFKSIKGDESLINKRKSFGATENINILLLDEENKQIKFENHKWNKNIQEIEVFDSYFIETNVYLITLGNYDQRGTFFEVIIGDEVVKLADKAVELMAKRKRFGQRRRNYNYKLKTSTDSTEINSLQEKIKSNLVKVKEINSELQVIEDEITKEAENFGKKYLEKINQYLRFFNPTIQLTKLNKKGARFVYYIKIENHDVRSDSESISLKHTLSEGDKSSLALSFFLARLSLKEDLSKYLVVFDDPISSFDHSRRATTINQLNNISNKCGQFILLSHDLNFIKDFSNRIGKDCLNLKITNDRYTSLLSNQDIYLETMTGITKDLTLLYNFIESGVYSDFDRREIVRCIRPTIEGMFRIKFFRHFKPTEWLGDMIGAIRESDESSIFFHLKPLHDELSDINDYSKTYHHSNPNHLETPINDEELKNYVSRTLELLVKI